MGKLFKTYLEAPRVYVCNACNSHLSSHDQIVSKLFHGRHGKAYLFSTCVNVTTGPKEDRVLITGLHTVADIYCIECQSVVGWKYEEAYEETQKYKVGKFILEKAKIQRAVDWR